MCLPRLIDVSGRFFAWRSAYRSPPHPLFRRVPNHHRGNRLGSMPSAIAGFFLETAFLALYRYYPMILSRASDR